MDKVNEKDEHSTLTLPSDYPVSPITSKSDYKAQLEKWQTELFHVQQAYFHQNRRAIVVFEGWDASGKGGAIRRITERLDPRGYRVHPIGPPSKASQRKHYLYRFWRRLPRPGTLAIFDRSYYGRVLVERVDKLATDAQWQRAYNEINEFEQLLIDDDVKIIKLFMHISSKEQRKRFEERLSNPYKRWKLTEADLRNRQQRSEYITATNEMFAATHRENAPWHIINAEYKWHARVSVLKTLTQALGEGVDISPPPLDEALIKLACEQLDVNEDKLDR